MKCYSSGIQAPIIFSLVGLTISFFWIALFEFLIRPIFPAWKQLIISLMLASIAFSYYKLLISGHGRVYFLALPNTVRHSWKLLVISLLMLSFGFVWSTVFQPISVVSALYTIILYATPIIVSTWFLLNVRYLTFLSANKTVLGFYVLLVSLSCVGLILDKTYGTFTWVIPGNQDQFEFWTKSLIDPTQVRQGFFFGPANTVVYPLMLLFALAIPYLKEISVYFYSFIVFAIVYATQSTNSLLFCICFALIVFLGSINQGQVLLAVRKPLMLFGLSIALTALLWSGLEDRILTSPQLSRAIENVENSSQVDRSGSRVNIWITSLDSYSMLPPAYQLLGAGYGGGTIRAMQLDSNGDSTDVPRLGHGESSYLQALGEAGLVGLMLRLLPLYLFVFAMVARMRHRLPVLDPIAAYIVSLYVANSFAPHMETYHVQYSLGFALACYILYSEKSPAFA